MVKGGKLVEMGTHSELLQNHPDGTYAGFVSKQQTAEAAQVEPEDNSATQNLEELVDGAKKLDEVDPAELEMKDKVDKRDEEEEKAVTELREELNKKSILKRLYVYQHPKVLILVGLLCSVGAGTSPPVFGLIMSKLLGVLTVPVEFLSQMGQAAGFEGTGIEYGKSEHKFWVGLMAALGAFTLVSIFFQKQAFFTLGSNLTFKIRTVLYQELLQKHMGWYDDRDNGTSVLTSAMAEDTGVINGASTDSLGPQIEGLGALLIGLLISLIFCWQMALITLALSPAFALGRKIGAQIMHRHTNNVNELQKEANLLCGDAITNFKTVQSLGHLDTVYQKYVSLMTPGFDSTLKTHIKTGIAFGMSQGLTNAVTGILFFSGGKLIQSSMEKGPDPETGRFDIDPTDVFAALFSLMWGASHMGSASAFAPDIGKAQAAAERIFKLHDFPSKMNACAMDSDTSKKSLNLEDVQGKIEFRDVWFRYPTRKEDFVLRGLSITVNPSESVALVGESGCGKSTFVSLLMRFYDVDAGEILLDGVNIKELKLHDLRMAVSLVMQEPVVFNYSILENVLYGKQLAKNSEVLHAAEVANAMEFIDKGDVYDFDEAAANLLLQMKENEKALVELVGQAKYDEELEVLAKLKEQEKEKGDFKAIVGDVDSRPADLKDKELCHGFETQCGLRGSKLSGGQKQRVAIARTIIRKPKVLLLDEATSALDEDSQKKVQAALNNAMEGRTTIVIAHRLSTIEGCDKIFVLDSGKVVEEGGFAELKQKGGKFSTFTRGKH